MVASAAGAVLMGGSFLGSQEYKPSIFDKILNKSLFLEMKLNCGNAE
jgi:hypothetical protein